MDNQKSPNEIWKVIDDIWEMVKKKIPQTIIISVGLYILFALGLFWTFCKLIQ